MRDLVEFVTRALVSDQEAVEVVEAEVPAGIRVTIRVAEDDMGKIIGRQGRIVRALRTVVKAAAIRKGTGRVDVEVTS